MTNLPFLLSLVFLLHLRLRELHAFSILTYDKHHGPSTRQQKISPCILYVKRYGPPSDTTDSNEENTNKERDGIKTQFTSILYKVMETKPEDIPSLLTQNMHAIMTAMSTRDLLEEILQDETDRSSSYHVEEVSDAVDTIVTFVESFVEQTSELGNIYKTLLGKIFKLITPVKNNQIESEDHDADSALNVDQLEAELDKLLVEEKEAFTPGFLRHLEGECERIGSGRGVSPESTKMLQILRLIQARVLEELGKGIGEGAVMLGQLLGYDNKAERLAVLDAGLTVRGVVFASELSALTSEALDGFKRVKDVDPELVKSIEEIDERIRLFTEKNQFQ